MPILIIFYYAAARHNKIGHQGGSGLCPRIALAMKDKINALRFYYAATRHNKIGHQGGSGPCPRIALAMKDKINALRFFIMPPRGIIKLAIRAAAGHARVSLWV